MTRKDRTRVIHQAEASGWPNEICIDRRTKWGNPFRVGRNGAREEVVKKHCEWLESRRKAPNGELPPAWADIIQELQGKILVCHCKPLACHGDALAEIADGVTE